MLEEKIKNTLRKFRRGSLVGFVTPALMAVQCGTTPTYALPANLAGKDICFKNLSCCSQLRCDDRGFDYCSEDGLKTINSEEYTTCHCYDRSIWASGRSGSGSSDNSWKYSGGKDGPAGRDSSGSERSGSYKVCKDK